MRSLIGLVSGLLFGAGLAISGMIQPAKVLSFLDVAGAWDPSLALVMAGALAVTFAGYRLALSRPQPLYDSKFHLPTASRVDARLLAGAALFGLGWGLGGYCPGPALAAAGGLSQGTLVFLAGLVAGTLAARVLPTLPGRGALPRPAR
jgi:uncharacterized membrane protein YedE/YeeE